METMQLQFKNQNGELETVGEFSSFHIKTPDGGEFELSWDGFLKGIITSSISKEYPKVVASRNYPNIIILRRGT